MRESTDAGLRKLHRRVKNSLLMEAIVLVSNTLTHKAYEFYAMTNRMVRTQVVKMGLTDLSDSCCVSVVLIKASLVLLSCQ